jgi:hypothetical protein
MENAGDPTQGVYLPPANHTTMLAERAAAAMIHQHARDCTFVSLEIERRLRNIEGNLKLFVGLMVGSGLIGGISGTLLQRLLP